jgi:hypothetical protein
MDGKTLKVLVIADKGTNLGFSLDGTLRQIFRNGEVRVSDDPQEISKQYGMVIDTSADRRAIPHIEKMNGNAPEFVAMAPQTASEVYHIIDKYLG